MTSSVHALHVVEFDKLLQLVAERCVSSQGAERILAAEPRTDREAVREELARVNGVRTFLRSSDWGVRTIPAVYAALERLRVPGTVLSGEEARDTRELLAAARTTLDQLSTDSVPERTRTSLAPVLRALHRNESLERELARTVDDDGVVRDSASGELRRVRRELAQIHDRTIELLERTVAALESHHRVPDIGVTVRDGRYVIAVRREGKGVVGGIVHDTSASGGTLFMEPPAAIELGNRARELQGTERREVERVLRACSDSVRPNALELLASLDALVTLDTLFARARFADAYRCGECALADAHEGFSIRNGYHPLLLAQGIDVVPFTLELTPNEHTLLVSGPNTGGKTVLLKAVALISAMTQAGIPAPVDSESTVPVFADFFADIGDEQSIEASLSTFSGHLQNIKTILASADENSLVLIDEIGSGTDPVEGGALAAAVLAELSSRKSTTLATTHLGSLQQLATEVPGIVNASLQFDSERLAPTYRFVKGIPGRSWGLGIARRLGLPAQIVNNAEERIPRDARNVAALIASLEERTAEVERRAAELARRLAELAHRESVVAASESRLQTERVTFEREARKGARRYLLDAREEVESAIRELRSAEVASVEELGRRTRQRVEQLAAAQDARIRELDTVDRDVEGDVIDSPHAGDHVIVDSLGGQRGTILELRGDQVLVAIGAVKLALPVTAVRRTAPPKAERIPLKGDLPEVHARTEVDLRGMRVEELQRPLMDALDEAIRADLHALRVIHGKGTGALRARVRALLDEDRRVAGWRPGAWNEGGDGVTIVQLR